MRKIDVCPSTLAVGYTDYSPTAIKKLFNGKKASSILDFSYNVESIDFAEVVNRISVSGVQEKLSAVLDRAKLIITPKGEQGRYIIKPTPSYKHLHFREFIPANEHLTMQIAKQVFKMNVAENGLVFFANGDMGYITKRFDFDESCNKIKQEDFSSLAKKSTFTHGKDFKYTGSYEDVAKLLRDNVSVWQVEISKLFTLIVFNYLFCNGDAHLKNFSLQQSLFGDYMLSPAYDLMNTSLHVQDEDFALEGGLIPATEYSEVYTKTGHPCKEDFVTFANRIGVLPSKRDVIIKMFTDDNSKIEELIRRSYLDERTKRMYIRSYQERKSRFMR